jgi:hypothetical protein
MIYFFYSKHFQFNFVLCSILHPKSHRMLKWTTFLTHSKTLTPVFKYLKHIHCKEIKEIKEVTILQFMTKDVFEYLKEIQNKA